MLLICMMVITGMAVFAPDTAQAAMTYPETGMPYWVHVSRSAQLVTVYDSQTGDVVRQMICSTGAASSPTITGTFKMPNTGYGERKNWYFFGGSSVAHYATRIKGRYLFHSILYSSARTSALKRSSWTILGSRASHGCVRMTPLDAQWIAYNCAPGTIVRINDSKPAKGLTSNKSIKNSLPKAKSNGQLPGWEATLKFTGYPAKFTPTLKLGIYGSRTKSMQSSLKNLGYYGGSVKGSFGEGTQLALTRFQEAYIKLNPSGLGDDNRADGEATPVWQTRIKDNYSNRELLSTWRTLKSGTSGLSAKRLREQLKELRYTTAKVNSKYDKYMVTAVKLYQRAHGLKIDGIATQDIQQAILKDGQAPLQTARVNIKSGLSVRTGQSSKARRLVKLKNKSSVRIVKDYGDWTYIAVGSKAGYVLSRYLEPIVPVE